MTIDKKEIIRKRKKPTILNIRLQELREAKGETQRDISEVLNTNDNKIVSWYEKTGAMPSYERLIALARHFNVSLDYLFGLNDIKPNLENKSSISDELATLPFSDKAIRQLKSLANDKKSGNNRRRILALNKLLENPILLDNISSILNFKK